MGNGLLGGRGAIGVGIMLGTVALVGVSGGTVFTLWDLGLQIFLQLDFLLQPMGASRAGSPLW